MTCTRPALRYMGGKWRLAPRIIQRMPPHRTYLEPYGGAASVLLRKPRAFREIYNDLDGEVVNLFRVLRDRCAGAELARLIELTPWARAEFEESYLEVEDPIERARRTMVRSFMGFGSTAVALRRRTGFRALSEREGKPPQGDWMGMPAAIAQISERLSGVVIENKPAMDLMAAVDGPETLIFADPPYVHATRSKKRIHGSLEHAYAHEMTDAQHAELLAWLAGCGSMVMLSGYRTDLYDEKLKGWERCEVAAHAHGGRPRTECLWINPAAQHAAGGLFAAYEG
ncbi:DNA adenine methylase [Phenylobacterium sp.]|uniref:DNA adenine methylase n=1 Tax=Phenylobacterium sp. TaxID=1871053 RepID=UPI002DE65AD2|nr:DNA adenine methylase [Phenylobacterium sp.]